MGKVPTRIIDWTKLDLDPEVMKNVHYYYQPPANIKMEYPAIVYKRTGVTKKIANDVSYKLNNKYELTIIEQSRMSNIADEILKLPYSSYDTEFVVDGLNHTTIILHI